VGKEARKGPPLVLAAIITTLIVGAAAAGGTYLWANQNGYAAKVNGEVVSSTEYDSIVERAKKQYAGQIGMDFNSAQGRQMLEALKKNIMNSLVDMTVMKQKAKEMNLTVNQEEYDARYKEFLRSRYNGTESALDEDLKKNRITKVEFEKQFHDQILLQKLYQKVVSDIKTTDADLKAFYDKNKARFEVPEQISARHILIKADKSKPADVAKAKAKAEDLIAQLKGGANFEELAKKYSEDDGSKPSGGDLGNFSKGRMVPEFEAAAWSLKPGEITQTPVQTNFGFHIIKRGPTTPGSTRKFEEVKDTIKAQIKQDKERTTFESWLKEAKAASKIDINEEIQKVPASTSSAAPGAPANGPAGLKPVAPGDQPAPPAGEKPADKPADAPPADKPADKPADAPAAQPSH